MPAIKPSLQSTLLSVLGTLVLATACTRLLRAAGVDSEDFRVYWTALTAWLDGRFPYLIQASDQGFVFKYPPWTLPFLLPFHWLPFEFSKAVWAGLEFLALGLTLRALKETDVSRRTLAIGTWMFWYLWLAHFYAGQLTIFFLAGAVWVTRRERLDKISPSRIAAVGLLFSAKIFSVVSLAAFGRRLFERRTITWGLGLLAVFHFALWALTPAGGASLVELYRGWLAAAASGASGLGAEVVRGTGNHGFPAVVLRVLDPEAQHVGWDLWVSIAIAILLGTLWSRYSKEMEFHDQWAGWLALGVAAHPLAWHHSFVLAFPLAIRALHAAEQKRDRTLWGWSLVGIALMGLLVPQVVGKTIVKPFELCGNKSWGVVLLAATLVRAHRSRRR